MAPQTNFKTYEAQTRLLAAVIATNKGTIKLDFKGKCGIIDMSSIPPPMPITIPPSGLPSDQPQITPTPLPHLCNLGDVTVRLGSRADSSQRWRSMQGRTSLPRVSTTACVRSSSLQKCNQNAFGPTRTLASCL